MPLSLSHLGFGYLNVVVRPDLGCDGESWHRSKPLQRCKLKITGLCKLCTYGCTMIGAWLYNDWSLYNSRNYANPHFRAVRLQLPF